MEDCCWYSNEWESKDSLEYWQRCCSRCSAPKAMPQSLLKILGLGGGPEGGMNRGESSESGKGV
jgi:hypothetical protein